MTQKEMLHQPINELNCDASLEQLYEVPDDSK